MAPSIPKIELREFKKKLKGMFNVHYSKGQQKGDEEVYAFLCKPDTSQHCDGKPGSISCRALRIYRGGEIRDSLGRVVREAGKHTDIITINQSFHQCKCRVL